jgi:hypothetical protein
MPGEDYRTCVYTVARLTHLKRGNRRCLEKAKVSFGEIEGLKITAELAAQYQLHLVQIHP